MLSRSQSLSSSYTSSTDEGFAQGEQITLTNTSASTGLAEDVEWNNFHYYHDHNDNDTEYSKLYITRGKDNSARGLFMINYESLLENNSSLYGLLKKDTNDVQSKFTF